MKIKFVLFLLFVSFMGFSQNGKMTIDETFTEFGQRVNETDNDIFSSYGYFEVTKEMFQMLSEVKEASPEFKAYISKLHKLKLVKPKNSISKDIGKKIYDYFLLQTNLKEYARLMTRKDGNDQLSFYKKDGKNENEFLLVSTDMIIYITGTIDLKSIQEFEQVMEVAGSAFDM